MPHTAQKGKRMNTVENYYMQLFYHPDKIIEEQTHKEISPLFELAYHKQPQDVCV
jgi:hypothetical protein